MTTPEWIAEATAYSIIIGCLVFFGVIIETVRKYSKQKIVSTICWTLLVVFVLVYGFIMLHYFGLLKFIPYE